MEDQQKVLTKWVQILIESEMPKGVKDKVVQQYLSYFMRLLSARMGSSQGRPGGSEEKMYRNQLVRQAKTSQQQLRVQELLQKLDRYPNNIQNKLSIFQLLYKLSDSSEIKQSFSNVEAIFKSPKESAISINSNAQNGYNPISLNNNGNSNAQGNKSFNGQAKEANYHNSPMDIEGNTTMNTLGQSEQHSQQMGLGNSYRSVLSSNSNNQQFLQTIKRLHNKGNQQIDLSERDLIRDLIYVFQGIDGHYIVFNTDCNKYQLKLNVPVSDPVRQLVNKLCFLGDLYRKTHQFLQVEPQGQIKQALHIAIKEELNEYYRLIAIFENEMNSNHTDISILSTSTSPHENAQNQQQPCSLSLRKLQLWIVEPQERLKWLAIICDATIQVNGFQVISAVNAYETQGSPPIQQLISRILQNIVQPFVKYVNQWVYNGELHDPLGEFLVSEIIGERDIWNKRYSLQIEQIPTIIDKSDAQTIFNIGRSVNFLLHACKTSDWKLSLPPCDLKIVDKNSFDVFKQWIQQASKLTNERIVNILMDKFKLKQHLFAIKKYLLMGQGDFIQQLMDLLSEQLSKNANEIHRHNLLGQLESAIRSSNAVGDNISRLDIKLLEASPGDKGWDIFSLDYNVDAPLDTILSPNIMRSYLKIFNFLWRIRRVNYALEQLWIDHMKQQNIFSKQQLKQQPIVILMKKFNILRHQMIHFINNLTCYIMVDAIETTWKSFIDDFDKKNDLCDIIQCHSQFVDAVLDKSLLLLTNNNNNNIYRQLNNIFSLIIKFRNTQLVILTEIQEELERIKEIKNINAQKKIIGGYDEHVEEDDTMQLDSEEFRIPPTAKQFNQLQSDYSKQLADLLILLKKEEKLRYLSFKLDFNEYYSNQTSEQLTVFNQEQLNKYSAAGNIKLTSNITSNINNSNLKQFSLPPTGLINQNNTNQNPDSSPFSRPPFTNFASSSSSSFNKNPNQFNGQIPQQQPQSQSSGVNPNLFFKPEGGGNLGTNNNISLISNNNQNSFFSSSSNMNKNNNSGLLKKDNSFLSSNSSIIPANTISSNNINNNQNFFMKSPIKQVITQQQDPFKPSINNLTGKITTTPATTSLTQAPLPQSQIQLKTINQYSSNLNINNNARGNNFSNKMEEEVSDGTAAKRDLGDNLTTLKDKGNKYTSQELFAKNTRLQPQPNIFFQQQGQQRNKYNNEDDVSNNSYKQEDNVEYPSKYNLQQQDLEDEDNNKPMLGNRFHQQKFIGHHNEDSDNHSDQDANFD